MSKVKIQEKKEEGEFKAYSLTIEEMIDGKKKRQCLIVKILNPITNKYDMFESAVPKNTVLGREVAAILKEARKASKDALKKNK